MFSKHKSRPSNFTSFKILYINNARDKKLFLPAWDRRPSWLWTLFESNSGEGEVSHSQKNKAVMSSVPKSFLFGVRSFAWPGDGGAPVAELLVCCKCRGLDPGSRWRSAHLGGERRALLLISGQGEAGGRTTQVQVSVPAPSSAPASPPSIMWSISTSQKQRLQLTQVGFTNSVRTLC